MHDLHFQVPTVILPAKNLVYSMVLGLDFIGLTGLQLYIKDQLYSLSGDLKNRVFPFQPPITSGDSWMSCIPPVDCKPTASLYSSVPPVQIKWSASEYIENYVQEETSLELVELVQSKVNESNLSDKESHVLFTLLFDHPGPKSI